MRSLCLMMLSNNYKYCENSRDDEITDVVPVFNFHSKILYKNIHCAACNNNTKSNSFLKFQVSCQKNVAVHLKILKMMEEYNMKNITSMLLTAPKCRKQYWFTEKQQQNFGHVLCDARHVLGTDLIGDCGSEWKNISDMCKRFSLPVKSKKIPDYIYNNPFCALCKGDLDVSSNCNESIPLFKDPFRERKIDIWNPIEYLPNFKILLDFSNDTKPNPVPGLKYGERPVCPPHQFLLWQSLKCIKLKCLVNGSVDSYNPDSCEKYGSDLASVPSRSPIADIKNVQSNMLIDNFILYIAFKNRLDFNSTHMNEDINNAIRRLKYGPFKDFRQGAIHKIETSCSWFASDPEHHFTYLQRFSRACIKIKYTLFVKSFRPHVDELFAIAFPEISTKWQKLFLKAGRLSFVSFSKITPKTVCKKGILTEHKNVDLLTSGSPTNINIQFGILEHFYVHIPQTNVIYPLNTIKFDSLFIVKETTSQNLFVNVHVCEPIAFHCNSLLFQRQQYQFDRQYIVMANGRILSSEIGSHALFLANNQLLVCTDIIEEFGAVEHSVGVLEKILTIVGCSFSLLGLVVTLVTYLCLPSLRNSPGFCIINIIIALFLAHIAFVVSPLSLQAASLCFWFGVVQHYCWLIAFFWTNCLAYDTVCTFQSLTPASENNTHSKRFPIYCLYGYGLPFFIMSITVTLSKFDENIITYSSNNTCWLSPFYAVLYFFAIPLALILTINLGFFIKIAISIAKLRLHGNEENRANGQINRNKTNLIACLKLTIIFGFTWFIGFLANVPKLNVLNIVFIALNSFQGLFICFAFAITPRIFRLWSKTYSTRNNERTTDGLTAITMNQINNS